MARKSAPTPTTTDALERLASLKTSGHLSEEEFSAAKAKLLSGLPPGTGGAGPSNWRSGAVKALFMVSFVLLFVYGLPKSDEPASAETASTLGDEPSETECRKDLQCWGDKHAIDAAFECEKQIERLSKFSMEWTDGMLDSKLSRLRWLDEGKGQITYLGDKAKFQNGFGAWQNVVYECDFDPETGSVLDARAREGLL